MGDYQRNSAGFQASSRSDKTFWRHNLGQVDIEAAKQRHFQLYTRNHSRPYGQEVPPERRTQARVPSPKPLRSSRSEQRLGIPIYRTPPERTPNEFKIKYSSVPGAGLYAIPPERAWQMQRRPPLLLLARLPLPLGRGSPTLVDRHKEKTREIRKLLPPLGPPLVLEDLFEAATATENPSFPRAPPPTRAASGHSPARKTLNGTVPKDDGHIHTNSPNDLKVQEPQTEPKRSEARAYTTGAIVTTSHNPNTNTEK
uniref:Uncharacterized protein n=1 Tax=Chromera velia CCMP2878 TaxID=1169474 RepID=A0A0G4HQN3_9ALVE|eukprot:Cvel_7966.t1-p1 / transcript=Cvel_7966.t1 / gene=Cvel_7966 / organism=Chromera_velia_CCMP2878 / gene_product=hypothetical protein / transcript_product=hypothetical protein / location=Cvel_scaffold429:5488-6861(+) / protein_length=254 / sequence_SO=supercontig / SO=protein_coding / is_pseudo=false